MPREARRLWQHGIVASKHAEVYLNDHLAGSTGALEMLDQLAEIDGFEQWAPVCERKLRPIARSSVGSCAGPGSRKAPCARPRRG